MSADTSIDMVTSARATAKSLRGWDTYADVSVLLDTLADEVERQRDDIDRLTLAIASPIIK